MIETVSQVPFGEVVLWVGSIIAIIVALAVASVKVYKFIEKYRKARNTVDERNLEFEHLKETIEALRKSNEEQFKLIHALTEGMQQVLSGQLNSSINRYYDMDCIPIEELSLFQKTFSAYEGVNGNGEMKERYNKILEDLPVKKIDK